MEEVQTGVFSCNNTQYYCSICDTTPSQLSHHKAHLKTQKHIYKRKCFEQCVNITVFDIHNYTKDTSGIIKKFEEETNNKFIQGEKESHSKFREWRFNYMENNEVFFKKEFPKVVIPPADCEFVNEPDFTERWLKKIIEINETVVIKPTKRDNNSKYDVTVQEKIISQTIEEVISKAIQTETEFDVALVLYKLTFDKYAFKSFKGNVWIDKSNISLSANEVSSNIRKEINTTLKSAFENFSKTLDIQSVEYKKCLRLISKFTFTNFKNNIIREAKEIFFDG
jgi:hypothetical protein